MFTFNQLHAGDRVLLAERSDNTDSAGRGDGGTIVTITYVQESGSVRNDGRYTPLFQYNGWWRQYEDAEALEMPDGSLVSSSGIRYTRPEDIPVEGPSTPLGDEHFPIMTGDRFRLTSVAPTRWSDQMRRTRRGIVTTSSSGVILQGMQWHDNAYYYDTSDIVEIVSRAPMARGLSPRDKVVLKKTSPNWDSRIAQVYGGKTVTLLSVDINTQYITCIEKLGDKRFGSPSIRFADIERVLPREDGFTPTLPYIPNVGDEVVLIGEEDIGGAALPERWPNIFSGLMGAVVKVVYVSTDNRLFRILATDINIQQWNFRNTEIVRLATTEDKEAYKIREAIRLKEIEELKKTACVHKDQVEAIAIEVFGKERVQSTGSAEDYDIIIHVPKIEIKNSEGASQMLTDFFVNYHISQISLDRDFRCTISFSGARTSFTLRQLHNGYTHSHISGFHFAPQWGRFCLGHSDYRFQMENTRMNIQPEDWGLLFHGLEYYLAWESLEGGPYHRIGGMANPSGSGSAPVPNSELMSELTRMFVDTPFTFWEYASGFKLNPNNPDIQKYFNDYSRIRKLHRTGRSGHVQSFAQAYEGHWYEFNGTKFPFTITDEIQQAKTEDHIDQELVRVYCSLLENKIASFIKDYNYDRLKESNKDAAFTKIRIYEQAEASSDKEPAEADQDATRPRW